MRSVLMSETSRTHPAQSSSIPSMAFRGCVMMYLALLGSSKGVLACEKTADDLSFSNKISHSDEVRIGMYQEISCCANNFVGDIKWFREVDGNRLRFNSSDPNYELHKRGQLLKIHKVSMKDAGIYLCVASDDVKEAVFKFTLDVLACPYAVGQVTPLKVPNSEEYTSVGETLRLECKGDFGCGMKSLKNVLWMSDHRRVLQGDTTYYTVNKTTEYKGTILGSVLTFKKVTEANFTMTFRCNLILPEPRTKTFSVVLKKRSEKMVLPMWLEYLLIAVGSVVFVIIAAAAAVLPCRHQVHYWLSSKLNRQSELGNDKEIALLSSMASKEFVSENIFSYLDTHYDVFYHYQTDLNEGQAEAIVQLDGLQRCPHVVIYLSEEEARENFIRFFIETVYTTRRASSILIIHNGPLKRILRSLKPEASQALRIVKHFEWPSNAEKNSRRMKNFWCSVKLCLPMVKQHPAQPQRTEDHERHSSSSSESALLNNGVA